MKRFAWVTTTTLAIASAAGAAAPAAADIYGWVDSSGGVTYSNLPPPKGAKVIDVIKEVPPTPQSRAKSEAAAHDAEMQQLHERLRQVEWELQQTRRMMEMPYPGPPPGAGYAEPQSGPGCDASMSDCGMNYGWAGWGGPAYANAWWWNNQRNGRGHNHKNGNGVFINGKGFFISGNGSFTGFHPFNNPVGGLVGGIASIDGGSAGGVAFRGGGAPSVAARPGIGGHK